MFKTKADIMIHRKKEHQETVKPCSQFQSGTCRFKSDSCWFDHEINKTNQMGKKTFENMRKQSDNEQVFQEVLENLKPPIDQQTKLKKNQD